MCRTLDSVRLLMMSLVLLSTSSYGAWTLSQRGEKSCAANLLLEYLRGQQLDADRRYIDQLVVEQHVVIDCLLKKQLTLAQAAAAYRAILDRRPKHLQGHNVSNPYLSEEHLSLRVVLARAETEKGHYPDRPAVLKQLRAEYEMLCENLSSPEPASDRSGQR